MRGCNPAALNSEGAPFMVTIEQLDDSRHRYQFDELIPPYHRLLAVTPDGEVVEGLGLPAAGRLMYAVCGSRALESGDVTFVTVRTS